MKKFQLFVLAAAAVVAQPVFASGSLDYICAAQKSNLRYEYHEGEEVSATLSYAVGIDVAKAERSIIKGNALTLDAFQVSEIITRDKAISYVGCIKEYNDKADYDKCMADKESANVESKQTAEGGRAGLKYNRIVQTVQAKDGTKIVLNIRNYDQKSYEGDFEGTLNIVSAAPGYQGLAELKVNCTISTP